MGRQMKVTYFDADDSPQGKLGDIETIHDLSEIITEPVGKLKRNLPLFKFSKYRNNYRNNHNVEEISAIEVDYDGGDIPPWLALETLQNQDLEALLYTTPSHREEVGSYRWRIILPLSKPVSPEEHQKLVARVNGIFGGALADESFVLSQAYYYGSIEGQPKPTVLTNDGDALDSRADLDSNALYKSGGRGHEHHGGAVSSSGRIAHKPEHVSITRLPPMQIPFEVIAEWLKKVSNNNIDWNAWSRIGMGIYNCTQGSKEGKAVFSLWSSNSDKHDQEHLEERWEHWGKSPSDHIDGENMHRVLGEYTHHKLEAYVPPKKYSPNIIEFPKAIPKSYDVIKAHRSDHVEAPFDFVEDLLVDGNCSIIFGESNVGKTFVAFDLGIHVAMGRTWLGKETEQGGVLYIAAEGGASIQKRLDAFYDYYKLGNKDIPFWYLPISVDLRDPEADKRGIIQLAEDLEAESGTPIRLIIVDTLSRALAGGAENTSEDMSSYIMNTDHIREALGAHLLSIHHSGKDSSKGARGWSGLKGSLDSEIEVIKVGEGFGVIKVTKQRDIEPCDDIAFRLNTVEVGVNRRGKPITSCVVLPTEFKVKSGEKLTEREIWIVDIVNNLMADEHRPATKHIFHFPGGGRLFARNSVSNKEVRSWFSEKMQAYENTDQTEIGQGSSISMDALYKAFNRTLKSLTKKGKIVMDKEKITLSDLTEGA